ncbi:hypothetical protein ACJ3XI_06480 [Litorimonas sp. RW-G-Af-16]|uniref:hypothetical protein n=1 Tax=Litorimonas sp. RW-G-Af-16 TaxID=3241168 RepID=UPI00390CC1E3
MCQRGWCGESYENVQVIDGADNCTYDVFRITDAKFATVFPNGQDIQFIEDLIKRLDESELSALFDKFWDDRLDKKDVVGIHGTLFYELAYKKKCYPTKKENDLI